MDRDMGHIIGIWDISWGYGTCYRDIDRIYYRNMEYITGAIPAPAASLLIRYSAIWSHRCVQGVRKLCIHGV